MLEPIKQRMIQLHHRFSCFERDSEISQINEHAGRHPVAVSEDTFHLLSLALEYARETQGTFDVTAGPMSQLWKTAIRSKTLPSQAEAARCRSRCNIKNLELDPGHGTAFLREPGMKLDLGGMVKGYAADEARSMLQAQGVQDAQLNFGGTVVAIGRTQNVGIQNPFEKTGRSMATLPLNNRAIVTSGSYEQCFFHQGNRFHHIIDPRTGAPSCSGLVSVSLIGDQAVMLDAWATGICCLGQAAAMPMLQARGISAVFVTDQGSVQITPDLQGQISFHT